MSSATRARKYFEAALELREGFPRAMLGLALAQSKLGMTDDASQNLLKFLALEPDSVRALFELGRIMLKDERYEVARDLYDQCQNSAPSSAIEHSLGYSYEKLGAEREALNCYKRAASYPKARATVFVSLGFLLNKHGDLNEAVQAYWESVRRDPKALYGYIGLGNTRTKQGRILEAFEAFSKAAEIDPDTTDVTEGLEYARAMLKNSEPKNEQT